MRQIAQPLQVVARKGPLPGEEPPVAKALESLLPGNRILRIGHHQPLNRQTVPRQSRFEANPGTSLR